MGLKDLYLRLVSPQKALSWSHPADDFWSGAVALSRQVAGGERNSLCFPGTFFAHADLQSLRLCPFTDGWHPFVVAAEVVYLLFLLYYMIVQVRGGLVAPRARDGDGCRSCPLSHLFPLPWSGREGPQEGREKDSPYLLP